MPDTYLTCCYNIYRDIGGNKIEKASFCSTDIFV